MTTQTFVAGAVFAMVTSITPGPNNTMLLASGMNFGFARTVPHMLRISLGFPVMLLLAVGLGLGRHLPTLPQLHQIIEVVGAVCMLWMAWQIANAGATSAAVTGLRRPLALLQAAAFQW